MRLGVTRALNHFHFKLSRYFWNTITQFTIFSSNVHFTCKIITRFHRKYHFWVLFYFESIHWYCDWKWTIYQENKKNLHCTLRPQVIMKPAENGARELEFSYWINGDLVHQHCFNSLYFYMLWISDWWFIRFWDKKVRKMMTFLSWQKVMTFIL